MARRKTARGRGWFAIGAYHPKYGVNVGTLWRSALILGADFIFTIQPRFPARALPEHLRAEQRQGEIVRGDAALKQPGDTMRADRHIPYFRFDDIFALQNTVGLATLVGIELDPRAKPLCDYAHPLRGLYLLGAEDHGLPAAVLDRCDAVVQLPGEYSMNVSVAGSIVMYDRITKGQLVGAP